MPTTTEIRGIDFELARPLPKKDRTPKTPLTAHQEVVTGAQFELSKPAATGEAEPKHPVKVVPKREVAQQGETLPQMSEAQKFLLARPGDGKKNPSNDSRNKGGREH